MKKTGLILVLLLTILLGASYAPDHLIVKIAEGVTISEFQEVIDNEVYTIEKVLVKRLGIILIRVNRSRSSLTGALTNMRSNPWVIATQRDHKVTPRVNIPDDSLFVNMWGLNNTGQSGGIVDADIDAPAAWVFGTGGVNALGDTIVVAVIDGGCKLDHVDLVDNIWVNRYEIPGNGIDDDRNGYIDDVHGWNAYNSTGNIPNNMHGTHVSGTIGARGNNDTLVTGVNWNVKIMPIAGSTSNTSVALEAYGYVLYMRALYNETGGDSGAFVVVTNSSFGIDSADCSSGSYPLWNNIYEAMGQEGILSVAATVNTNMNIDKIGDVPTGCQSDFIVSVTNTTRYDTKFSDAGYGHNTIDLGAPGTSILSTSSTGGTTTTNGTSMAAPHVAGSIAFLHSVMNTSFVSFYKNNPSEGALLLKEFLLAGIDTIPSLENVTVSGGRLNLYNSTLITANYMGADSLDPNPVENLNANTDLWYQVSLNWIDPTTTFGGDSLEAFVIDVYHDDSLVAVIPSGIEHFTEFGIPAGTEILYSLKTRILGKHGLSLPATILVTGSDCLPGDIYPDAVVNSLDIFYLQQFILGLRDPEEYQTCPSDLDYDEEITIYDLLMTADKAQ